MNKFTSVIRDLYLINEKRFYKHKSIPKGRLTIF